MPIANWREEKTSIGGQFLSHETYKTHPLPTPACFSNFISCTFIPHIFIAKLEYLMFQPNLPTSLVSWLCTWCCLAWNSLLHAPVYPPSICTLRPQGLFVQMFHLLNYLLPFEQTFIKIITSSYDNCLLPHLSPSPEFLTCGTVILAVNLSIWPSDQCMWHRKCLQDEGLQSAQGWVFYPFHMLYVW